MAEYQDNLIARIAIVFLNPADKQLQSAAIKRVLGASSFRTVEVVLPRSLIGESFVE